MAGFSDLILLWRGPTGVADQSGIGNDGSYLGGMGTVSDSGEGGSTAFEFDGDHAIDGGDIGDLGTQYSVGAWVKFDSLTGADVCVSYRTDGRANANNIAIQLDRSGSDLRFLARDNSLNIASAVAVGAAVADTWIHLVGVRDGNTLKVYVDGVEEDSDTVTFGTMYMDRFVVGTVYNDASNMMDYTANKHSGLMDAIAVFDGVLSDTDIADWYAGSRSFDFSGQSSIRRRGVTGIPA